MHARPLNQALVSLGFVFLHVVVVTCNCCLCFLCSKMVVIRFVFITSQSIGWKDHVLCTSQVIGWEARHQNNLEYVERDVNPTITITNSTSSHQCDYDRDVSCKHSLSLYPVLQNPYILRHYVFSYFLKTVSGLYLLRV